MRRALVWLVALLAACASLEIRVLPPTATPRAALDLAGMIESTCGAAGNKWNQGCLVELPKGVFEIGPTKIGECTNSTSRNGLTIRGQGSAGFATQPPFPMAATALVYQGPPGGRMLDVCGSSRFTLEALDLDGTGASVAVRLSANNSIGAISHFPTLHDLSIIGAEIGIEIAGENFNDQTDFVTMARVSISGVDTCYLQDSQQTVGNLFHTVECAPRHRGFVIRGGSLDMSNWYVGQWPRADGVYDPDFIGVYLTKSALSDGRYFAHHQVSLAGGHTEIISGKHIAADVSWSVYPLNLAGNSFSLQGIGMNTVIDSREKGWVLRSGNVYQGSTADGSQPRGRSCATGGFKANGETKKPEVASLSWTCW